MRAATPGRRVLAAGAAAVALGWALAPSALAADSFTVPVTNLTGLAADADRQVYWAVGKDSGNLTALTPTGAQAGSVRVKTRPTDVQAVAYRAGRVWIGDIGDPSANRPSVQVLSTVTLGYGGTADPRVHTLTYPDGPHDSAAMGVSPRGRIYLVTRGTKPGIYRTAGEPVQGANALIRVADAPAGVTDLTFSTDGSQLVLRTAAGLQVLDSYKLKATASGALAGLTSGEALAVQLGTGKLLASGEGSPTPVSAQTLPTSLGPLPTAAPSPSPSASASKTPSTPGAVAQAVKSAGGGNKGMLVSLVAAGVISLGAAAVVAIKR